MARLIGGKPRALNGPLGVAIKALRKQGHIVEETVPSGRFSVNGHELTILQVIGIGNPKAIARIR